MKKAGSHNDGKAWEKLFFPCFILIVFFLFSCNTTRRVPNGQYLLTHNTVVYAVGSSKGKGIEQKISTLTKRQLAKLTISPEIASQYILAYVKQKPNTKIVGMIPLHLLIYNLVNPEKAEEKKIERDHRIDEKNKKRIAEGKKAKSDQQIRAKKEKRTFREWLMSVGEPPVVLDSSLMSASLRQVIYFLHNKGYYRCKVHDSVRVKNKKVKVFYVVVPGKPYKIDSVQYNCEDSALRPLIYADTGNCLINKGDIFDVDNVLKERDRITHYLNDNGYYAFGKEFIHYVIDTNMGNYRMDITINISKFAIQDSVNPDSNIEMSHRVYHIRNVTVQMHYNPTVLKYSPGDTIIVGNYVFVYPKGKIEFKPNKLLGKLFIKKGDIYNVSNVDYTYTGLTQLKTFRYINIKFVPFGHNMLDCFIQLMPTLRQSIGIEGVVNNTGGDKGIQGDLSYENKSLFRGGEVLQFKIKGGLEAEKILATQTDNKGLNRIIQLNTIDIGPEFDFSIPRPWFPFNLGANIDSTHTFHRKFGLWPKANPQTVFKASYDYQNRPLDYARHIFGLAYTFNYDPYERKDLKKWNIEFRVPEINYVHATVFPDFQDALVKLNNFFLLNSFTNHFIPDIGTTVTFSNQALSKPHNFIFFKADLEESGYVLRVINGFPNETVNNHTTILGNIFSGGLLQPDVNKSYSIAGVPYSYYVKGDFDFRQYLVYKDDQLAFREFAGIGVPMAGVPQELPFDKSFWGGGANDIRGWQARALGPGGYSQSTIVDQIGDIKLEANAEYRVSVIKLLGLALFVDAGNVWLLETNPAVPNGDFRWSGTSGFLNQIAVAGGVGLRLDFTYFIFRFDYGLPIRDPAKPAGQEWMQKLELKKGVLQYGIGYPF